MYRVSRAEEQIAVVPAAENIVVPILQMKITDKIHALKHIFFIPVSPELKLERFVYSFMIFGKKDIYLIDSGIADSENDILNYIAERGYSPDKIKYLILTHSHPDHIGSAGNIKEKYGCEVIAHKNEMNWIENIENQFKDRPVPGFMSFVNKSVKIDKVVQHDDIIDLERDLSIRVIHTPGHSSGSISLHIKSEGALICADSILLPGSLPIYENPVDAVRSINKLREIKNIGFLLSSWDDETSGDAVQKKMEQSIAYLKAIHKSIGDVVNAKDLAPMDLCKKVIMAMGLPAEAVNPLVAKSFQSNLTVLDNEILR